ncbi:OB-fold nucleic acid binding domain-containing protein [Alteromonas gracilis]
MSDVLGRPSLRRTLSRWANSDNDEARDLRRDSEEAGLVPIADAPDRELVTVQGTLRTVTLRPRGGTPALEADLYDGSEVLTLIWLGRRRITGIAPGRKVEVTGRIGRVGDNRVLYNPRYRLRPETP